MLRSTLLTIILSLMLAACGGGGSDQTNPPNTVVAKGTRILAIDVTEAETTDYDTAVDKAANAGAEMINLSLSWTTIETSPGVYDNSFLSIADIYYPLKGIPVNLSLQTINTNQKEVPSDLQAVNFDDPVMISRFKTLLDFVFAEIPNVTLNSLAIGNEIDAYLVTDAQKWAQYQNFYTEVSAYARTKQPGLKIGTKATYAGITSYAQNELLAMNALSDVVMVTYYPLNSDFTVKAPGVVATDFSTLVALYPADPIYMMEVGYPSGALCNSSESLQSDFVREVFEAWDTYNTQIQFISFTWLTDLSGQYVQDLGTYYGLSDPIFLEYLGTIGLRTYSGTGTDKQAFSTLANEASKRGWHNRGQTTFIESS